METPVNPAEVSSEKSLSWDDDPRNPLRWKQSRKWMLAVTISATGFLSTFGSSSFVAANSYFQSEFGVTRQVADLSTSLYVLGMAAGPFLFSPLSEIYGRQPAYVLSMTGFTFFSLGLGFCHSFRDILILRFFCGVFGSSGPSLGAATITDLFIPAERGKPISLYALGPMSGPVFGTMIGFWLVIPGWRWIAWTFTIMNGLNTLLLIFCMRETFHSVLRKRIKHKEELQLINEGKLPQEKSKFKKKLEFYRYLSSGAEDVFSRSFSRPLRLLINPVCFIFCLYFAYIYALIYMFLVAMPLLFGKNEGQTLFSYQWPQATEGLSYLSIGLGFFSSAAVASIAQDKFYRHFSQRYGEGRPEYRLILTQGGVIFLPIGLLIWGWTAHAQAMWVVPMIGIAIFTFGLMQAFNSIQTYLLDCFAPYSASAMAVATLLRSIAGCVLPLFSDSLFTNLGWGIGATVLASIAVVAVPAPAIMWVFGPRLRERYKFIP